jgi:hypothetical protein
MTARPFSRIISIGYRFTKSTKMTAAEEDESTFLSHQAGASTAAWTFHASGFDSATR